MQFKSNMFQQLMNEYEIRIRYNANYHPQVNPMERVHRVVKTMLTAYVSDHQQDWDKYLAKVACAIRSAKHEVTGFTPNFVNFGREIRLSGRDVRPVVELLTFERDEDKVRRRADALQQVYQEV